MATDIRSYDFKPGFKHEIEVLSLPTLYAGSTQEVIHPHRANFYHVFWFFSGPHVHQVDFESVMIPKNALFFVNKEKVQRFANGTNVDGKLILFTDAFFSRNPGDMKFLNNSILFNDFLEPAVIKLDKHSSYLADYFARIEDECSTRDDQYHYDLLHNHLCNFLMLAERERRLSGFKEIRKGPDLDYLTLFRELIASYFRARKSVNSYARDMNVSEKRLTQATIKTVGKTPKQMIDDRVLLEAKRLLVHTSKTMKEIGYHLGFDEPTNFIKYFRKHENCTPIEFREKNGV